MPFETLIYEPLDDHVVRLTLNRPEKLNAMSPQLLGEFDRALDAFDGDRDASVLIIRGAGRACCSGFDITPQREGQGLGEFSVTTDRLGLKKIIERWQRLWSLPKPTIAQVQGYCLAGGTELVGHCDAASGRCASPRRLTDASPAPYVPVGLRFHRAGGVSGKRCRN